MPLYEGIGLISEKYAVVIDVGSAYTKCGFAGESSPRCIVPSSVKCQRSGEVKRIINYKNTDELYDMLVDFIHFLYFRYLLVNPKDRRVVIVESLLCPTAFRGTLAKVLFKHYEVSSILFVPSHLVSLCTLGVNTALVFDVGYQEAVLIPVYEGVPVLHAWQAQPLAGEAVHSNVRSLMDKSVVPEEPMEAGRGDTGLTDSVIEDIKVRTCFVTTLDRSQMMFAAKLDATVQQPKPPPDVTYQLGGSRILNIPGRVRELSYDIMFEQDNDEISLSTMILDAILKCPVDMRKPLAENLLVIGGSAMALGFKARLLSELQYLLQTPKYINRLALKAFKFHKPPAKENYVAWLGGAIFGATDIVSTRSLSRDQYLKHDSVPDWANLLYNIKEDDKASL